eukprot:410827-Prymnesium_polylepis.4
MALPQATRNFPPFAPPKPSLASALLTALKAGDEIFKDEKYQTGMRRAFFHRSHEYSDPEGFGIWLRYTANRIGKLSLGAAALCALVPSPPSCHIT